MPSGTSTTTDTLTTSAPRVASRGSRRNRRSTSGWDPGSEGSETVPQRIRDPGSQIPVKYTCPMHPEIVRDGPGSCPICGMALEPLTVSLDEEENHELKDMTRRFWIAVVLTIPVFALGMSDLIPGQPLQQLVSMRVLQWVQLILATPVVLWCGWPFFVRAWESIVNRSLNMFTLIGLGVGVGYLFSVIAVVLPEVFPASFRDA